MHKRNVKNKTTAIHWTMKTYNDPLHIVFDEFCDAPQQIKMKNTK